MSVSNKIRALLSVCDKKAADLADPFNISVQAIRNKFTRGSFSAEDLIQIADYLNCELSFTVNNQKIILDMSDVEKGK